MRRNYGQKTWLFPMPVLIIGTYDEEGNADVMNAAWGGVYDEGQIMLSLSKDHKTTKNILASGAFTVSYADAVHMTEADYVGLVSGNDVPDKLERAGFTPVKSEYVNAPLIRELPVTAECRLIKVNEDGIIIGEIVNVSADESVVDENGEIDVGKLKPLSFEPVHNDYRVLGEKIGNAFEDGEQLK